MRLQGDLAGCSSMYVLKSCPIVRSLGKLTEKGYAFVWGEGLPFLVPPNVDYSIEFDHEACIFGQSRWEVPIFSKQVQFTSGLLAKPHAMPAELAPDAPRSEPRSSAGNGGGERGLLPSADSSEAKGGGLTCARRGSPASRGTALRGWEGLILLGVRRSLWLGL